jgi:hypothetical protein
MCSQPDLVEQIQNDKANIIMENHEFGMPPAHYDVWPELRENFDILTTTKDRKGVEYVSTIEHRRFPFFGSQVRQSCAMSGVGERPATRPARTCLYEGPGKQLCSMTCLKTRLARQAGRTFSCVKDYQNAILCNVLCRKDSLGVLLVTQKAGETGRLEASLERSDRQVCRAV